METFIRGQNRYNNMGSHNHQKAAITKKKERNKNKTDHSLGNRTERRVSGKPPKQPGF